MASQEIVVLSSSPSSSAIATILSSPELPSPLQLMLKRSTGLPSGSPKTAGPDGTNMGFTTASSLLRQAYGTGNNTAVVLNEAANSASVVTENRVDNNSIAQKPDLTAKHAAETIPKNLNLSQRKPHPPNLANEICEAKESKGEFRQEKSKHVRKPRIKKCQDEAQTKIKKGRVIKPVACRSSSKSIYFDEEPGSREEPTVNGKGLCSINAAAHTEESNLGLDKALPRRKDWTPVKNSTCENFDPHRPVHSFDISNAQNNLSEDLTRPSKIEALLDSYEYEGKGQPTPCRVIHPQVIDGESITKKRKLELINSNMCPPPPQAIPAKKKRPPKKKLQTVTAKATENFVISNNPNDASLLEYFSPPTSNPDETELPRSVTAEQTTKSRRRKLPIDDTTRTKKTASRLKNQARRTSFLLSPEEAIQSVNDQDLLFGTSSQLAREESPTFVKEVQKAMKISEANPELSRTHDGRNFPGSILSDSSMTSKASLTSSRNLWSIAHRDLDGAMLEPEVINLADTPKGQSAFKGNAGDIPPVLDASNETSEKTWPTINDFDTPRSTGPLRNLLSPQQSIDDTVPQAPIPKSVAEAALRQRPKSQSTVKKATVSSVTQLPAAIIDKKPDFQSYTIARLSKALKSYGLKPVKSRNTMITLLERCWEGKTRLALKSLPPNVNTPRASSAVVTIDKSPSSIKRKGRPAKERVSKDGGECLPILEKPPPKPRGRPRKVTGTSTNTSTPPKKSLAPIIHPLLKPQPPTSFDPPTTPPPTLPQYSTPTTTRPPPLTSSFSPSRSPHLSDIFTHITHAVTSYPPTHDPNNLTFQEKILIYDPIVLEDLASWLNTVGLGKIGVDGEVGAMEVRAWCEAKSICCVWNENLKGGTRGRY